MAIECIEDHAVTREGVSRSGLFLQRRGDQTQSVYRPALLKFEDARQMQRIEVVRFGRENCAVDAIGLVKPTLPVEHRRLLDRAVGSHKPLGHVLCHGTLLGQYS